MWGANPPSTPEPIERRSAQSIGRPSRHQRHIPHVRNAVSGATSAPSQASSTPSPTASTRPATSWPSVTGGNDAYSSSTMCRSVPQIPAAVTAMRASPGPGMGTGTSASDGSPGPGWSLRRASISGRPARTHPSARTAGRRPRAAWAAPIVVHRAIGEHGVVVRGQQAVGQRGEPVDRVDGVVDVGMEARRDVGLDVGVHRDGVAADGERPVRGLDDDGLRPGCVPGRRLDANARDDLGRAADDVEVRDDERRHAPAAERRQERLPEEAPRDAGVAELGLLDQHRCLGEEVAVAGVVPVEMGQQDEFDVQRIDAGGVECVARILACRPGEVLADELGGRTDARDARVDDDRRRTLQDPHDARDRDELAEALRVGQHRLLEHRAARVEGEDPPGCAIAVRVAHVGRASIDRMPSRLRRRARPVIG